MGRTKDALDYMTGKEEYRIIRGTNELTRSERSDVVDEEFVNPSVARTAREAMGRDMARDKKQLYDIESLRQQMNEQGN